MSTQSGPSRLLDSTEVAALSLPDESMPVTPTVGKPGTGESTTHSASASEHSPGLNDSTDESEEAGLPTDPPSKTED